MTKTRGKGWEIFWICHVMYLVLHSNKIFIIWNCQGIPKISLQTSDRQTLLYVLTRVNGKIHQSGRWNEDCWLCFLFSIIWCWELLFLLGRNCIQSCVKIIVSYLTHGKGILRLHKMNISCSFLHLENIRKQKNLSTISPGKITTF